MIRARKEWNSSLCNPFNNKTDGQIRQDICENEYLMPVPEKPQIVIVKNPRVAPFAKVEFLRTPILNLHFELYKFAQKEDEYLGGGSDFTFTVWKYNSYLPKDVFKDNSYYVLRVRASNETGYSLWSDVYILDYVKYVNENNCYEMETMYLDCDIGFCCSHIYVCT